jgi:hypothetical protein
VHFKNSRKRRLTCWIEPKLAMMESPIRVKRRKLTAKSLFCKPSALTTGARRVLHCHGAHTGRMGDADLVTGRRLLFQQLASFREQDGVHNLFVPLTPARATLKIAFSSRMTLAMVHLYCLWAAIYSSVRERAANALTEFWKSWVSQSVLARRAISTLSQPLA